MAQDRSIRTYQGWQHEQVAFLLGLTGRQAALVAVGAMVALQPIATAHIAAAVVAWPLAAVFFAAAFVRAGGRTVDEWVVTVVSFGLLRVQGKNRFLGGAFAPRSDPAALPGLDLPGVLAPLRLLTAESGSGGTVGVLHHPLDGTYAAVAAVAFPGLGLVDSTHRDARVDAWGGLLASVCAEDHPFVRLQVVHRAVPEHGEGLRAWHVEHVDPAAPLAAVMANEALLASVAPASSRRQTWVVATMDARRVGTAIRAAGGGDVGACAVLMRHVRALTPALAAADLRVQQWLDVRDVAEAIRTGFDPDAARQLDGRRAAATGAHRRTGVAPGVDPTLAGPAAAEAHWSTYRHDGAVSVTYSVHAWPLAPVHATSLAALLAETPHRRTVAIHYEPLGPREAARKVMAERTRREVTIRMRQRTGQAVSATEQAELARAAEQDAERAAGHGLVRFTAYITVTCTDPDQLDDACAEVQGCASAVGVELRRMYGAQDVGLALTLPVGTALPKRRW